MARSDPITAGMPGRYATALFELADESGAIDGVASELAMIRQMLDESQDLTRLVRSPVFTADEQSSAIAAVLAKAGISGLTLNFVKLVTRNRRLFALRDMIRAYRALVAHHRGELTAEVRSAIAINEQQVEELKQRLRSALGHDVQVETAVDPSLLGGLVVKVGSRMIDSSLRTKLNNLKVAMKEVG